MPRQRSKKGWVSVNSLATNELAPNLVYDHHSLKPVPLLTLQSSHLTRLLKSHCTLINATYPLQLNNEVASFPSERANSRRDEATLMNFTGFSEH